MLALNVHSSALEAPLFEDALLVARMECSHNLVTALGAIPQYVLDEQLVSVSRTCTLLAVEHAGCAKFGVYLPVLPAPYLVRSLDLQPLQLISIVCASKYYPILISKDTLQE